MKNLDRFDRMLLAAEAARVPASGPRVVNVLPAKPAVVDVPYITSERAPRFVDHTACPMCGTDREGIEYHGTLMTGAKVHTIAAHTAGMRRVQRGQPRCLGSGMRLVFEGGVWKGAPNQ